MIKAGINQERTQLPARVFQAVPDLGSGNFDVDTGNRLVIGKEDTRTRGVVMYW